MRTKRLINSFKYAGEGISKAFQTERNMKIHTFIMLCVIGLGIFLRIRKIEWLICILLFSLVIGGELFNTAIEIVIDIIMPNKDEKAKLAKDVSAGAVLVLAIGAGIVGVMIFGPKMIGLFVK